MRLCDVDRKSVVVADVHVHLDHVDAPTNDDEVLVVLEVGQAALDCLKNGDWWGLGQLVPPSLRPKRPYVVKPKPEPPVSDGVPRLAASIAGTPIPAPVEEDEPF